MKLKHFDNTDQAHFITCCTHQRLPLITNNKCRQIIVDAISFSRTKYKYRLIAYVLMPEHVHLIILPPRDCRIGIIAGEIKQVSSRRIHEILLPVNSPLLEKMTITRNRLIRFTFWQRRCYDHTCRDEDSMWEKVNYCHNNPVKRGLVKSPADWPWSSYRVYNGYENCNLGIDAIA